DPDVLPGSRCGLSAPPGPRVARVLVLLAERDPAPRAAPPGARGRPQGLRALRQARDRLPDDRPGPGPRLVPGGAGAGLRGRVRALDGRHGVLRARARSPRARAAAD